MTRRAWLLVVTLLLGGLLRAPFLVAPHREGDERDAIALVAQISQGEYSLRHATEINRGRRTAYVDAELYHHPPLYSGIAWLSSALFGQAGMYLISYVASLAVLALTFWTGSRLQDTRTGFIASLIVMACPITQLISGKIWAEATLSALMMALIASIYAAEQTASTSRRQWLALGLGLGLSITLTRQVGIFALGFVVPAWWCLKRSVALRLILIAAAAGLCAGLLAWFVWTAWRTGSAAPAAVSEPSNARLSGFVAMLMRRNPLSFLYIPLLLCPLYLCAFGAARDRRVLPLVLFESGYAVGLTALASLTNVTFHMKYLAPALPALAVAAAWQLVAIVEARRWLGGAVMLGALAYAAPMLHQLTITLPKMAEVDPRFFYSAFDALPW